MGEVPHTDITRVHRSVLFRRWHALSETCAFSVRDETRVGDGEKNMASQQTATTVLRSTDLPVADRFDWWCETIGKDTAPTKITSPFRADFRATAALTQLGEAQLSALSCPPIRSERTPALIRCSDPERYELALITGSDMWMAQHGREVLLHPGDLLLYETSRPFDSRAPGRRRSPTNALILHVPRNRLAFAGDAVNGLLARQIPGRDGLPAVLAGYLRSVHKASGTVSHQERQALGQVSLDLVAATVAALVDAEAALEPESQVVALRARIDRYIEQNLSDRDLTAEQIAAAHHISLSHLYKIYRPNGMTIAAWIRHRRLERCRSDLADPKLRSEPVHKIAARHGLGGPSEFSRSFRARCGMTPSEFRHHATRQAEA
jgi:AraC-like DNA-binding protein